MKGVSSIIFPVRAPTSLCPPAKLFPRVSTSSNWYIRYKVTKIIFIQIYVCWLTLSVTPDPAGFCVEMKSLPLRSLGLIIQLKFFFTFGTKSLQYKILGGLNSHVRFFSFFYRGFLQWSNCIYCCPQKKRRKKLVKMWETETWLELLDSIFFDILYLTDVFEVYVK